MIGHSYTGHNNDAFWNRATWQYKFAILPKKCEISKKYIWLSHAYLGTAVWTGPGEPAIEYKWLTAEEFVLGRLRGIL